jgi:hypothetical protein
MFTVECLRCLRSSTLVDLVGTVVLVVPGEQLPDSTCGQRRLGKEPKGRAGCNEFGVVLFAMCRDQDHCRLGFASLAEELSGKLEAALAAEVDIDQNDIWPELCGALQCLRAARCAPHDGNALSLQEAASRV